LFRQEILSELPVEQLALRLRADFGRPAKELPTVSGVLVLQQMHDLTALETVNQLAFNQQWHYALDIPSESDAAKYMGPKTLWSMRRKVTDQELDTVWLQRVTHKLAQVFEVKTTKPRLDSVHLKSNMRRRGRLGILSRGINRFLVNLKRRWPPRRGCPRPRVFLWRTFRCRPQARSWPVLRERRRCPANTASTVIGSPFHRRGVTPVPQVPAARSSRGSITIICATLRRRGVWPRGEPTSRPRSFVTATVGGPVSRVRCPKMTGSPG
jgi:hypothetical protein